VSLVIDMHPSSGWSSAHSRHQRVALNNACIYVCNNELSKNDIIPACPYDLTQSSCTN
jgi:hypothetical protein